LPSLVLQDKTIRLHRFPLRKDDPLQPWDSADEYLLKQFHDEGSEPGNSILVVNDAFGALTTALHAHRPTTWNDSHLSRLALEHNLVLNDLSDENITFVTGDLTPPGSFDLVLLKIPKSLAYLEDVLLRLRNCLRPGSVVMAGGMIKHTPARVYRLMEGIIGPVRTSLGWRKARLATAAFDPEREHPERLPDCEFVLEDFGWNLANRANVFSRDHLDLGTRLLLKHLPTSDQPLRIADLGCGNGVLALALARKCPTASILGVDESHQAVASARTNIARTDLAERDIIFSVADGLAECETGSLDLVICNPPFHIGRATGDLIAWRMFEQAKRSLQKGGELRIVGNRHLGYHLKLKRLFGTCEVLGSDRKFVVLSAIR
jgi:23S rRNA (guanine1835-N2)-methyltransferase